MTTKSFAIVDEWRPRKTVIREIWTDLGEGLVRMLLSGRLPCLGHLLLG